MLSKTITYTDFNGQERTETFYFNLTKRELVKLEASDEDGLAEKMKRMIERGKGQEILDFFEWFVLEAYGVKSDDGRRFIKTQELRDEFEQTAAYSELYMSLATNAGEAVDFVNGLMPDDLVAQMNQDQLPAEGSRYA